MEITKNTLHTVTITGYSSKGAGVARIDSLVVFVEGAVRGDECVVRILKVNASAAYAKIEQMIQPSEHRRESDCPYFPLCGGCDLRHVSYEEELYFKTNIVTENLKHIGGIETVPDAVIGAQSLYDYRNKALFPVGINEKGRAVTGFYRERSHQLIPVNSCMIVQAPRHEAILSAVRRYADLYKVPVYDESTHTGILRHVLIRSSETTGETMVCLIINSDMLPHSQALVSMLQKACPELTTAVQNTNRSKGNSVTGPDCITLFGEGYITDRLLGLTFRISPLSFYQINSAQAEKLYRTAVAYAGLTGSETVFDLYCGTGTIGLCMAASATSGSATSASASKVIGVEIVPQAVADARDNAHKNGINNAEFICGDAAESTSALLAKGLRPDVIVTDPPRKGLSPELIQTIFDLAPSRLVYISCDPATLSRDLRILKGGGYELKGLTVVDMFPRTVHVECVVLMSRV